MSYLIHPSKQMSRDCTRFRRIPNALWNVMGRGRAKLMRVFIRSTSTSPRSLLDGDDNDDDDNGDDVGGDVDGDVFTTFLR